MKSPHKLRIEFILPPGEPEGGVAHYGKRLAEECSKRPDVEGTLGAPPYGRRRSDSGRAVCSLQFVPFGYQRRGLPFGLASRLKAGFPEAQWHVMFHELWVGAAEQSSLKHICWGWVQKMLVVDLVKKLRPICIHTHAEAYRQLLGRAAIEARLLPLFDSVPLASGSDWDSLSGRISALLGGDYPRDKLLVAGVFGSIHPEWDPVPPFRWLVESARRSGRKALVLLGGRSGLPSGWWSDSAASKDLKVPCLELGELPPQKVSRFLNTLDVGFATTPWGIIEKSASVATMLDHGLPVVVSRDDWKGVGVDLSGRRLDPRLVRLSDLGRNELPAKVPPRSTLADVADQFLADLERSLSQ